MVQKCIHAGRGHAGNQDTECTYEIGLLFFGFWFFGMFLMAAKRFGEFRFLKENERAAKYRKSFQYYTEEHLLFSMIAAAVCFSFLLGALSFKYSVDVMVILPFLVIWIVWFFHLACQKNTIVKDPERVFEKKIFVAFSLLTFCLFMYLFFSGNQLFAWFLRKEGPCRVYTSDAASRLSPTRYTYPDVVVTCDERDRPTTKQREVQAPRVVIEVSSESTERYDRGRKFGYYRACPTVQEYVLVNTEYQAYGPGDEVELTSIDVRLSVAALYKADRCARVPGYPRGTADTIPMKGTGKSGPYTWAMNCLISSSFFCKLWFCVSTRALRFSAYASKRSLISGSAIASSLAA